jgi:hypothetical protein
MDKVVGGYSVVTSKHAEKCIKLNSLARCIFLMKI